MVSKLEKPKSKKNLFGFFYSGQMLGYMKKLIKAIKIKYIVLTMLLLFIWTTKYVNTLGEFYARYLYPVISKILSSISGLVSFSLGDIFILLCGSSLIGFIIYAILKKRSFFKSFFIIIEFLLWIYVWFYFSWGINYFRKDFYERAQITYSAYSEEGFKDFLELYTTDLNKSWIESQKIDFSIIKKEALAGYSKIYQEFSLISPDKARRPKPMLINNFMSAVGVLGYINPFFNEVELNNDLFPIQYPFSYVHEMAHTMGVSSEAEANFYSFIICSRSDIPELRYSAYFGLFPYVIGNAHYLLDENEYRDWLNSIEPQIIEDYNNKSAFWEEKYNESIGKLQENFYNFFLESNKISSGTKNYSEVIEMLISYFNSK